jgi:hypothetical protein
MVKGYLSVGSGAMTLNELKTNGRVRTRNNRAEQREKHYGNKKGATFLTKLRAKQRQRKATQRKSQNEQTNTLLTPPTS